MIVAASLAVTGVAHADDISEAQTLFDQGIADLQAGKTDQACKELAASLAKHEDSGTKGALATCYGKIDKLASAWGLWKDLADTEPNPDMKADATKEAAALEPKLGHYIVKATTPPPGLVVTVNGSALKDFTVQVPLPIDAGTVAVSASAPGYKPWSGSATAADGQLTTIVVPALVAAPKEVTPGGRAYDPAAAAAEADTRRKRHLFAIGAAGVGVAAIVVGGVFGHQASSNFDQSKRDCGGNLDMCPGSSIAAAQSAFNSANSDATASTVLVIVGGAALAGAAVLWFTAPTVEQQPVAWRVTPSVDLHGGGLVLSGGF